MKKTLSNICKIKQIRQMKKWKKDGNKILWVGNGIRYKLETKKIQKNKIRNQI